MDIYLPDEFYALSEVPNPQRGETRDGDWLGGEAYVTLRDAPTTKRDRAEPDPIWCVV
jgi:hypothetical protein